MMEFLELLRDPGGVFLRQALVVALAASVAFGIMGTFVVAKRISSLAGASRTVHLAALVCTALQ